MDLFFHTAGTPDLPAVLFLHGSPLSGRMWQPQFAALSEQYYCLAPDLPGHGQSGDIPFSMPETVRLLSEKIASEAKGGTAHVVGLSFGGVVAQALMVQTPEHLGRVLLSGTATRLSRWMLALNSLNDPILRLLKPEQLAGLIAMQFGIPAEFQRGLADDFRRFSVKQFSQVMNSYAEIEMPVSTRSPVLVAVGDQETITAKWAARKLAREIPGAVGVRVPGAGHVWNLQAPALFNATLAAWLAGAALPKGLVPLDDSAKRK